MRQGPLHRSLCACFALALAVLAGCGSSAGALTHKKVFEIDQAGYTPAVSDGRRVYVVGYYTLVGLEPTKG